MDIEGNKILTPITMEPEIPFIYSQFLRSCISEYNVACTYPNVERSSSFNSDSEEEDEEKVFITSSSSSNLLKKNEDPITTIRHQFLSVFVSWLKYFRYYIKIDRISSRKKHFFDKENFLAEVKYSNLVRRTYPLFLCLIVFFFFFF